ncbi:MULTISPECIES: restriction endonuclease subunit S [Methylobacillus]|uniref:Restriction modification system DNA specificity domain n=1 Tax=Methylobacillus flagellatus (strain ATCC 51484 / DSM 6875 / VKM B-1610 / KT) TaxID=265072 RepID=Q1GY16_METFK|nr:MULTISPECIES: restriction endonuclease subunit S [Methylobacillus]ABE50871.1 restriction modification system DNA specificity domain [Methylobacillus flagellatus KT]MPS47538.1 restriction endonuclease subunit S [Methylobacillus sp.]
MSARDWQALPAGWSRRRLRFDVRTNPVKSELELPGDAEVSFVPMDAVGELGGLRLDQTRELADVYAGYTYFADGDVCIAKITPCFENGKGAIAEGLKNGVAFGTTELHVLRPLPTLDARFLFYLTIAHDFRSHGESEMLGAGGQKRVPEGFLKDWTPPLPCIQVQQRIARFLDEKTAQIDGLIEKKRALLDRLAEKRQALITRAVTKGMNPDAPMKPSGIDWLGDIPAHWEVRGLTKCTTRVDYRGATPEKSSSGVFLVTAKNIKNGRIDYQISQEYIPEDIYEQAMRRGLPKLGEVLFTTEAPLGEIAQVDREDIALAQRIIKFTTSTPELENDYLAYWMMSMPFQAQIQSRATGSTAVGLKASKIVDLPCLLPPKDEQKDIISQVRQSLMKIDEIETAISDSLEFKIEYRAALITAAVTGQIPELNG